MSAVRKRTGKSLTYLGRMQRIGPDKVSERHNHALNILFVEVLRSRNLSDKSSPWYSPIKPKPVYENEQAVAYWDVLLFADHTTVSANRIDVTVLDKVRKKVLLIEMTRPWVENREKKSTEKTSKYGPLRWELQMRYPGYSRYQTIQHSHRRPGWVFKGRESSASRSCWRGK